MVDPDVARVGNFAGQDNFGSPDHHETGAATLGEPPGKQRYCLCIGKSSRVR